MCYGKSCLACFSEDFLNFLKSVLAYAIFPTMPDFVWKVYRSNGRSMEALMKISNIWCKSCYYLDGISHRFSTANPSGPTCSKAD